MTLQVLALIAALQSPTDASITVQLDRTTTSISPSLYGIFFEEINQAGEGGIYAELLRSRGMEGTERGRLPKGWQEVNQSGSGTVTMDSADPLNAAHSEAIKISKLSDSGRFGVSNEGFWGISVRNGNTYKLALWVKGDSPFDVSLSGRASRLAGTSVPAPGPKWKRVEISLSAKGTDDKARLEIAPSKAGNLWIGMASLMPDTWKGRQNGMRKDLAETVDAMHPAFVRFPGGCYVEGGDRLSDAFNWKETVVDQADRKGLDHSMWGYSNSMGLGYHEYLQWCEDMGSAPLFVVNCGICHREVVPMNQMQSYVQDTMDAIEYANGPVNSKWGAIRAKNGHPKPFGLKYIEIGNENGAQWSYGGPAAYKDRYKLVFDAIKKSHPEIVTIADNPVPHPMEILDEHYYEDPSWFWRNSTRYDSYSRSGTKVYVGEYAVTRGCGKGNLVAALGEAAFMTGMERNSDVVKMSSYAPLFKNVNNEQWNPDAIVFDDARHYGTPSYYVQALFSTNRADHGLKYSVSSPPSAVPGITGTVGLMTWRTQAEYKDVEIVADGKKITPTGFDSLRGDWRLRDGVIAQTELSEDRLGLFKGIDLSGVKSYSVEVKARKTGGDEGFFVVMDAHDGTQIRWNIGGWANTQTAFERNGTIVGRTIPAHIETDRWYDIKLEREGNRTRGYIDGKLVQELIEQGVADFTAVAGVDDRSHELVLKVVNGSNEARTTKLNLSGSRLAAEGRVITLTGPNLMAENSFERPKLIAPVTSRLSGVASGMNYRFAPRSVTIVRIPFAK